MTSFKSLQQALPEYHLNLILVNDGTTFSVSQAVQTLVDTIPGARIITYSRNRGKGYALRCGVEQSTAAFILYTDIDFPYTPESMVSILNTVTSGEADIAVGIRNTSYYNRLPAIRRWISHWLRKMNRLLLGLKESDTQGGLKAMNGKGRSLFLATTIDRYLFDLEFIYLASHTHDTSITSVEVDLREGLRFARFKPGILFREGVNFLKILIRSLFGKSG